jgi:WD40 repeat protein
MLAILGNAEVIVTEIGEQARTGSFVTFRNRSASAAAFAHDLRLLALADLDGTIRVYDIATRQEIKVLEGNQGAVHGLAFVGPDRLISGCVDHSVRLWDFRAGRQIAAGLHDGPVWALVVTTDGSAAFTGSSDQTVRQWGLP